MLAHLTRMYKREDWIPQIQQAEASGRIPMLLERPLFERVERPAAPAEAIEPKAAMPTQIEDSY